MPAARYWRARPLLTYGEAWLELSAFHLLQGGVRQDAAALLNASVAPSSGSVSVLQGTDSTARVRWPVQDLGRGLAFTWDFGAEAPSIDGYAVGAGDSKEVFLALFRLEYSSDGQAWAPLVTCGLLKWPGAGEKVATPASFTPDPHFDKVRLLLHADYYTLPNGTATDKLAVYDHGPWGRQALHLNSSGNGGQLSTARSRFGGASLYFPLVSPNAVYYVPDSTVFGFPGDFCVEMHANRYAATGVIYDCRASASSATGFAIDVSSGTLRLIVPVGGVAGVRISSAAGAMAVDAWHHIAVTREAGTMRLFLNGVPQGSYASAVNFSDGRCYLGASNDNQGHFGVYLDEVRITAGAARYVEGFTPPDAPFYDFGASAICEVPVTPIGGVVLPAPVIHQGLAPSSLVLEQLGMPVLSRGRNLEHGGRGRVVGTVNESGSPDIPVYRRVRLVRDRDGLVVSEAWSHPVTGAFAFDEINESLTYTVWSSDHTGAYNDVVAARITPELMP